MRKIVLFMHVTLDGFVADPEGQMDWIYVDEDMFEAAGERTRQADTALYGRKTWEMMNAYWPTAAEQPNASRHDVEHGTWYNQVDKIVVSGTLAGDNLDKTTVISHDVVEQIQNLKQRQGREIVIFGSPSLARTLIQQNLIDDYWLLINPVILGQGIPLFDGVRHLIKLKLAESTTYASKVVCLHYQKAD